MILYINENRDSLIEISKDAPKIYAPCIVSEKNKGFYDYDPRANYLIKGYEKGPENSYAADLNEKFPLLGK